MDVDRPRITVVVRAPDAIEDLSPGVGPTRVGRQEGQQLEFLWSEMDQTAITSNLVGDEVEDDVVADDKFVSGEAMCPRLHRFEPT